MIRARLVRVAIAGTAAGFVFLASASRPRGGDEASANANAARAVESDALADLDIDIDAIDLGEEAYAAGGAMSQSPFVARARRGQYAPPDMSQVEHLCALIETCSGVPIPSSLVKPDFATCVKDMAADLASADAINFSLTIRECGLAANSCDQLKTCALRGAHDDACAGRGMGQNVVGFCDGDGRALQCWKGQVLAVRDCPRADEQCVIDNGQAQCILGPCPAAYKPGAPKQCGNAGNRILQCVNGKLTSYDCGAFGLSCVSTPGGSEPVGCATSAAGCTNGSVRCDGNVAVACHNGHEVRVSCADGGMVCSSTTGSTAVGACQLPPPSAKDSCSAMTAKCNHDNIDYCFGGKRSFSCGSINATCVSDSSGVHCSK
jgi:hypothetical protein